LRIQSSSPASLTPPRGFSGRSTEAPCVSASPHRRVPPSPVNRGRAGGGGVGKFANPQTFPQAETQPHPSPSPAPQEREFACVPGARNLELMEFEHHTPRAMVERSLRSGDSVASGPLSLKLRTFRHRRDRLPSAAWLSHDGRLPCRDGDPRQIHPRMVEVASMNQFLPMTSQVMTVTEEAGETCVDDICMSDRNVQKESVP
jgi:hypothetical protein